MTLDARRAYDLALRSARRAAYPDGQFVGQESFMQADEILSLARAAGIGPGVSVLDLCCGVAGPGRLITSELRCCYLGVDMSAEAVELAGRRARGLPCRFRSATVPPVPGGSFDVVLLLETMLAFRDKDPLLHGVSRALAPGGRFALTLEEGRPLTPAERRLMPAADTVWPIPLEDLVARLGGVGLEVRWVQELTDQHRRVAEALHGAFAAERCAVAARLGDSAVEELLASHRLWSDWMSTGRIRKFVIVAERVAA